MYRPPCRLSSLLLVIVIIPETDKIPLYARSPAPAGIRKAAGTWEGKEFPEPPFQSRENFLEDIPAFRTRPEDAAAAGNAVLFQSRDPEDISSADHGVGCAPRTGDRLTWPRPV